MAKKKSASKKKPKKPAARKAAAKKTAPKKSATLKTKAGASRKSAAKSKPVTRRRTAVKRPDDASASLPVRSSRGLGPDSGGQSGDIQGLSRRERYDSESVEELAEEGQTFEAEAVSGVENARDPDEGEVTTSEVPEDDVPGEYRELDEG